MNLSGLRHCFIYSSNQRPWFSRESIWTIANSDLISAPIMAKLRRKFQLFFALRELTTLVRGFESGGREASEISLEPVQGLRERAGLGRSSLSLVELPPCERRQGNVRGPLWRLSPASCLSFARTLPR